jgi:L-asparaginase II
MRARGESLTQNRHDCSGKHSGMLSFARMNGWSIENYLEVTHPVQEHILYAFSGMCGVAHEEIEIGIDGCSAPNFAVPLYNGAFALARLSDPQRLHPERIEACQAIFSAMTAHPEMVAGHGEFDTELMKVTKGRMVVKGGAEGYQGISVKMENGQGLGIAFKMADGGGRESARAAVGLEILRQLELLTPEELTALEGFGPTSPILNWRKLVVGESSPTFTLDIH